MSEESKPERNLEVDALNKLLGIQAQRMHWISESLYHFRDQLPVVMGTVLYDLFGVDKLIDEALKSIHQSEGRDEEQYAAGDRVVILHMFHHIPVAAGKIVESSNTQHGWWIVDVIGGEQWIIPANRLRRWKDQN